MNSLLDEALEALIDMPAKSIAPRPTNPIKRLMMFHFVGSSCSCLASGSIRVPMSQAQATKVPQMIRGFHGLSSMADESARCNIVMVIGSGDAFESHLEFLWFRGGVHCNPVMDPF